MAIIPNGRRRFSKESQNLNYKSTGLDGLDISQEVAMPASSGPATDFDALQNILDNPVQQKEVPVELQNSNSNTDSNTYMNEEYSTDSEFNDNLEEFIMAKLISLGVPERMFASKDGTDPFFQMDEDLDSETSSGFYLIPSYTESQKIGRDMAKKIALEIGQKFNLSQKITKERRNYKVKFQTKINEPQSAQFGTSFDDILKPGSFDQSGQRKSASFDSRHALIKNEKSNILDYLIKELAKKGES